MGEYRKPRTGRRVIRKLPGLQESRLCLFKDLLG